MDRSSTDNAVRTTRLITGQGRDMSNFKRKLHPDINDTNFKNFLSAHVIIYKGYHYHISLASTILFHVV